MVGSLIKEELYTRSSSLYQFPVIDLKYELRAISMYNMSRIKR